MAIQKKTTTSTLHSFPPLESLFSESFDLFTRSFKQIFLLNLLVSGISLILIVGIVILVVVSGILGAGLGGGLEKVLPLLLGPFAVVFMITILFLILLSQAVTASTLLILDKPNSQTIRQVIKSSIKYALPLIALGILTTILVLPTFILFIIPGILIIILLSFSSYELVLGSRGIMGSMRRSIYVVKSHFWSIFGRMLIMFGLYCLFSAASFGLNFANGGSPISMILSILFGFYALSYSITLYKQAEGVTPDKSKESSLMWLLILWVISILFASYVAFSIAKVVSSPEFQKAISSGLSDSKSYEVGNLTQMDADNLADDIFLQVNDYRQDKNLSVLKEDQALCAYAQKRLKDISSNGKYDDGAGLYEDRQDQAIVSAYFKNYQNNAELYFPLSYSQDAEEIVNAWAEEETASAIINGPDLIAGCARAVPGHVDLIFASE